MPRDHRRRPTEPSPRRARAIHRSPRLLALAIVLVLATVGVAVAAPGGTILGFDPAAPGSPGGLAKVGPVNPQIGFPDFYKDKDGTALEPCLDPKDTLCIMGDVPNPDAPLDLQTPDATTGKYNFPDEFFYQAAGAGFDGVGTADARGRLGRASLTLALEGAFAGGAPKPGDQMVFARFRARVSTGLKADADRTYKVVSPYGTSDIKVDAGEESFFVTEDIGITAGDFSAALGGRVGPFLRWTPDPADPLPPGYLGDPNVEHTITGGKQNTNYFAIVGPGVGANAAAANACPADVLAKWNAAPSDCIYTDLFSLMAKESTRGGVDVHRAAYARDADGKNTVLEVQAESKASTPQQNIVLQDPDAARRRTPGRLFPATQMETDNGDYYARVAVAGGTPPGAVEVTNYSDTPRTTKIAKVSDTLSGTATYDTTGHSLHVEARSSDRMLDTAGVPVATLKLPYYDVTLTPPAATATDGPQVADVALGAPPASVRVASPQGGTIVLPVTLTGTTFTAAAALRADAGRDLTVAPGRSVRLDGSGSSGNVDGYAWTGPYAVDAAGTFGAALDPAPGTLTDVAQAIASLVAPTADGRYGYRLTVTGTAGGGTAVADRTVDEAVVTVQSPAAAPVDTLAGIGARYAPDKARWVVDGTSTLSGGNEVTVYNGPKVGGDVIGTSVVDRLGNWSVDARDSSALPIACEPDPAPRVACVSVRSKLGAVVEDIQVDVVKPAPIAELPAPVPPEPPLAAPAFVARAGAAAARPGAAVNPVAALQLAPGGVALRGLVARAAVATTGIPVTVTPPARATVLRLRVLTTKGKALFTSFTKVKGGRKLTVVVRSRKLQQRLRRGGRYVLEATPGVTRQRLGKATRITFRVR